MTFPIACAAPFWAALVMWAKVSAVEPAEKWTGISFRDFTKYMAVTSDSGYTIKKGSKITVKGIR